MVTVLTTFTKLLVFCTHCYRVG